MRDTWRSVRLRPLEARLDLVADGVLVVLGDELVEDGGVEVGMRQEAQRLLVGSEEVGHELLDVQRRVLAVVKGVVAKRADLAAVGVAAVPLRTLGRVGTLLLLPTLHLCLLEEEELAGGMVADHQEEDGEEGDEMEMIEEERRRPRGKKKKKDRDGRKKDRGAPRV